MANGSGQTGERRTSPPAETIASTPGASMVRRRRTPLATRLLRDYPVLLLAIPGMLVIFAGSSQSGV